MAENSISILASDDNPITHNIDGTPAISSRDVALRFQKKHKHILEEIRRIQSMVPKDFFEPNFRPSEYTDTTGRSLPAFLLTRDAFSLLAMGFTGKAAIMWKIKYIRAFNMLELNAIHAHVEKAVEHTRLITASRALTLTPQAKANMMKVLGYRERGFTYREISKVMDIHQRAVGHLIKTARELGMGV